MSAPVMKKEPVSAMRNGRGVQVYKRWGVLIFMKQHSFSENLKRTSISWTLIFQGKSKFEVSCREPDYLSRV